MLNMNDKNKKDLILISTIIFTFLNIVHIYFPIHLIIELISIPLIIGEVAFLIICRKMKHKKTMNVLRVSRNTFSRFITAQCIDAVILGILLVLFG